MELQISIMFKENRAVVGVKSPDSDAHFQLVEGDIPAILAAAPAIVAAAQEKWKTEPKNPKAAVEAPKKAEATPSAKPVPPPAAVKTASTNKAQPSMF